MLERDEPEPCEEAGVAGLVAQMPHVVVIGGVEVGRARVGEHGRAVGREREDGIGCEQARESLSPMLFRHVDVVQEQGTIVLPLELLRRIRQQLTTRLEDVFVVVGRIAGVRVRDVERQLSEQRLSVGVHPEQCGLRDGCPDDTVLVVRVRGEAADLEADVPDVELVLVGIRPQPARQALLDPKQPVGPHHHLPPDHPAGTGPSSRCLCHGDAPQQRRVALLTYGATSSVGRAVHSSPQVVPSTGPRPPDTVRCLTAEG